MPSISAVIITYNEELAVGRCLDSLTGVADEIIVVDSFSTDRTAEICAARDVKFVTHPFADYIRQKNYANELATGDYILSIDADEALSDELRATLLEWKKSTPQAEAYKISRRNNYCGQWIRYSGWYPDRKIRMWKKGSGNWGGPVPHEVVVMQPGTQTSQLEGDILHWSYASVAEHEERLQRYARLAAESMHARGIRASRWMVLYKPAFRFVKHFFIKRGFIDGYYGYTISRLMAREVKLKYSMLYALNRK